MAQRCYWTLGEAWRVCLVFLKQIRCVRGALRAGQVPFLPGASTPSEIMSMREEGYSVLKFFPAEQSGGIAYLKALASPLAGIRFCPTGGVSPANAPQYLSLSNVVCVGGSWVAPDDLVDKEDWDAITALAREAAALARG